MYNLLNLPSLWGQLIACLELDSSQTTSSKTCQGSATETNMHSARSQCKITWSSCPIVWQHWRSGQAQSCSGCVETLWSSLIWGQCLKTKLSVCCTEKLLRTCRFENKTSCGGRISNSLISCSSLDGMWIKLFPSLWTIISRSVWEYGQTPQSKATLQFPASHSHRSVLLLYCLSNSM